MSTKRILAAVAAASLALLALPALAVGDEVDFDPDPHITVSGGTVLLETESESQVHCDEVTGTGEIENGETGALEITFHGCRAFGTNCQSAGQPTGTIATTENLPFHVVRLTDGGEDKPGILITPNTTDTSGTPHFVTFKCAGGLVTIRIRGNGMIGEITEGYGNGLLTYEIDFATNAAGTDQKYVHYFDAHTSGAGGAEEHTTRGPYRLQSSINGTGFEDAYLINESQMHFVTLAEITTTHTE